MILSIGVLRKQKRIADGYILIHPYRLLAAGAIKDSILVICFRRNAPEDAVSKKNLDPSLLVGLHTIEKLVGNG